MKKAIFLCVWFLFVITVYGQTEPLTYRTALNRFISYYNQNQPDSIFSMFSPEVKVSMPLDKNRQMLGQLQLQLGNLKQAGFVGIAQNIATYKVDFQKSALLMKISLAANNQISGLLFDNYGAEVNLVSSSADPDVAEVPFQLKTLAGVINGTYALPKQINGKVPVVLIVAGSGPTDRDGNKPGLNQRPDSYKLLAFALAKSGIASLRYDKRMIGQVVNPAKEKLMRFNDYVDDAVALITQLHDDPRFSKVAVLGHSEGSLVGMLATAGQPASGFVSVEGESLPADKILMEQVKSQPEFIVNNFKAVLDTMRRGKINEKVDPALYSVARTSVQPYLMSWMTFDPVKVIKRVKVPVLIVQGTNDLQVSVADAERLKKGKSEARLLLVDGMNYVLKDAPATTAQNIATYNQPGLPVKPELVNAVVEFVKGLK